MRVRALKRFRYDGVDRQAGETLEIRDKFLPAMVATKLVEKLPEEVAPPPTLKTRQVKAEEPKPKAETEPGKTEPGRYKRRDMRASED